VIVIFFFEEATTTVSQRVYSFIAPTDHVPVSR
jgi:hypothetical protein